MQTARAVFVGSTVTITNTLTNILYIYLYYIFTEHGLEFFLSQNVSFIVSSFILVMIMRKHRFIDRYHTIYVSLCSLFTVTLSNMMHYNLHNLYSPMVIFVISFASLVLSCAEKRLFIYTITSLSIVILSLTYNFIMFFASAHKPHSAILSNFLTAICFFMLFVSYMILRRDYLYRKIYSMFDEKKVYIYSTVKVYCCANIVFSFIALVVSVVIAGDRSTLRTIDCWANNKCDHIFLVLWAMYTVINTFSILSNIAVNIKTTNIVIFTHIASYILTAFYLLFDVTNIIDSDVTFVSNYLSQTNYFEITMLAVIFLSALVCTTLHLRANTKQF